jgi:putative membrane protein
MKTFGNIKTFSHLNLIIAASWLLISCNHGIQSNATMSDTSSQDTTHKSNDAKFLVKVALINMEEVRLGELARNNSSNKDVKELGEMMVEDHKKAQDELVQLATKKSITLPTSMDANAEDDYNKLSNKSGTEFDKEYTKMMVSGHKDAIALFKSESTDASDADIRQWAGTMIPTLQKHLDHATLCEEKCDNM